MARVELSFSDVYSLVSDFLGYGTSPSGTNLTKVQNLVYRAYRHFLYPINPITKRKHVWSFLKKSYNVRTKNGIWKYALPNDFSRIINNPQYGDSEPYDELVRVHPDSILSKRALASVSSFPLEYALFPVSQDAEIGTQWELWLWPTPNGANSISFMYLVNPERPSATTDYFLGGPEAGEVVLEMAYALAEIQEENTSGVHGDLAQKLLESMMIADDVGTADFLGKMGLAGTSEVVRRGFVRYGTDSVYEADR